MWCVCVCVCDAALMQMSLRLSTEAPGASSLGLDTASATASTHREHDATEVLSIEGHARWSPLLLTGMPEREAVDPNG